MKLGTVMRNFDFKILLNSPSKDPLVKKFLHDLGAKDAALKMLEDKVLGQTEEQDALYVAGMICKENGKNKDRQGRRHS